MHPNSPAQNHLLTGMFRTRFLRFSFFLSVLFVILIPLHAWWIGNPSFRDLLIRFSEENAVRLADHLTADIPFDATTNQPLVTDELRKELVKVAVGFKLYKYRLFDATGRIIHSSIPKEIGKLNEHAYFHDIVAKGTTFSQVVQKNGKNRENETIQLDVVETYVPIMRANSFQGAFEIYSDITAWRERIDRIVATSSLVLGLMALTLLTVILTTRLRILHRIHAFMEAIAATSRGDFSRDLPLEGHDELTDMAENFNRMSNQLHKLHHGLQNEKNKLTTIILSAREGIIVTDEAGDVVLVNPAAERLLGKSAEQIQREGFFKVVDDPEFVERFVADEGVDMPETLVYNQHVLQFYASTIHDRSGGTMGSAALLRDVTEEKKLEEKLRNQSITDQMTGLFNRRHAEENLQAEMQRFQRTGHGFAVALLDVDHFKRFNDEHGHDQGDRVLQSVARIIHLHYRQIDVCCRFGGEEFCIIMPGTSLSGALLAAQRLREGIEEMRVDGLKVTVSIGVAVCDRLVRSQEELIKRADQALYAAKHLGRNRVVEWRDSLQDLPNT
ncbi:MAG: diguanylate cyclase [Magnetococcales bacterium]|nr:diguanylate cyclase [Magnetococcales bacterium]